MIILDTHAWVWWVGGPGAPALSRRARAAIDEADRLGVSDISHVELAWLAASGKVALDRPTELWIRQALQRARVESLRIEPSIAVLAAELEWPHKDPADRLIVATALIHRATLVTRDRAIRDYDRITTVW